MARQKKIPLNGCDVYVISDDVGNKMAGPGIRAWELSRVLSKEFKVVLAIPDYSPTRKGDPFFSNLPFEVVRYALMTAGPLKASESNAG